MNDAPQLLLIIRTYNEAKRIGTAIKSYLREGISPGEILLADCASTDGTQEIARSLGVRVYVDPIWDGVERTNRAARAYPSGFIVVLDADMEAIPGFGPDLRQHLANGVECLVIPETSIAADTLLSSGRAFERSLHHGDSSIEAARGFSRRVWDECGGFTAPAGVDDWVLGREAAKKAPAVRMTYGVFHYELPLTVRSTLMKYSRFGHGYLWLLKRDPKAFVSHSNPIRSSIRRNVGVLIRHPKETAGFIFFKSLVYAAGAVGFAKAVAVEAWRGTLWSVNNDR